MTTRNNITLFAILCLGMATFVVSYMADHPLRAYLFNADTLYLPTLFTDLFSRGGSLADWYLTPAPYFFPDYPMFALVWLLGPGAYSQVALFGLLQILMTLGTGWLITRQLAHRHAFILAAGITLALLWLAMNAGEPFEFMLASASHYGIVLTGLLFVALWLQHEQPGCHHRIALRLAMSLIAFASTLSDTLFIAQVAAPFLATALLTDIVYKRVSLTRTLILLAPLVASALGSWAYSFSVSHLTRYPSSLGLGSIASNLSASYNIVWKIISDMPIYGLVLAIYLVMIGYQAIALISRRDQPPSGLGWLTLFTFMSMCATLSALALSTDLPISTRYFIAMLTWPVVVTVCGTGCLAGRKHFAASALLTSLGVVSMGYSTYRLVEKNGMRTEHYPSEIACIDQALQSAGAVNGVSHYWDAKYLQNFSHQPLAIAQYYEDLREMPWITSSSYFKNGYDFVIISRHPKTGIQISPEPIQRINDNPGKVSVCGNRTVVTYSQHSLHMRKFAEAGDRYQWQGCELPSIIGQQTPQCEIAKKDASQSGVLTYGPYEPLPAGQYELQLTYSSLQDAAQAVAQWEVVVGTQSIAKGALNGSNRAMATLNVPFRVEPGQHLEKFEFKTVANPGQGLKVMSLDLKRSG